MMEEEAEEWVMKEAGEVAGDITVVGEESVEDVVGMEKTRHDSNGR
jgi:hypothetical protein